MDDEDSVTQIHSSMNGESYFQASKYSALQQDLI